MTIRPEHLAAIENLGYTEAEAEFLYLVATHSGYFTRRQFLTFTRYSKGCLVHRLTTRTIGRRQSSRYQMRSRNSQPRDN